MKSYFRNLIVWQKAFLLSQKVYTITRDFPDFEKFALADQMRRASISIASNIAEGNGRGTNADYSRFLYIAKGSAMELITQLLLAESFGYAHNTQECVSLSEEIIKMITTIIHNKS